MTVFRLAHVTPIWLNMTAFLSSYGYYMFWYWVLRGWDEKAERRLFRLDLQQKIDSFGNEEDAFAWLRQQLTKP